MLNTSSTICPPHSPLLGAIYDIPCLRMTVMSDDFVYDYTDDDCDDDSQPDDGD